VTRTPSTDHGTDRDVPLETGRWRTKGSRTKSDNLCLMRFTRLFGVATLCGGCATKEGEAVAASATAAAAAAADPNEVTVGKDIVAAAGVSRFTEGKVAALEGTKVTYEYGEPDKTTKKRATSTADLGKMFLIGAASKAAPKVGDFVIAKGSNSEWSGCEVKSDAGGVLGCEDAYGTSNNVDPKMGSDLVTPRKVPDPPKGRGRLRFVGCRSATEDDALASKEARGQRDDEACERERERGRQREGERLDRLAAEQ